MKTSAILHSVLQATHKTRLNLLDLRKDAIAEAIRQSLEMMPPSPQLTSASDIVRLVGPQGVYTRIEPKDYVEAMITPEAGTWYNLTVAHIAALENDRVLIECHPDEAGTEKVYPSQIE